MSHSVRSTVYFDSELHQALRVKSANSHCSISQLVNDAVRFALREDQEDLKAFDERKHEESISYETLLNDLKSHGKL